MARRSMMVIALVLLGLAGALIGAYLYMLSVPGTPHHGALPALTAEEKDLALRLRRHVDVIAAAEHNVDHYDELEKVARYLEATLGAEGYAVNAQTFPSRGKHVRNIDVVVESP